MTSESTLEIPTIDQIRSTIPDRWRQHVKSILLANATAEGFANETSDIDILLLMGDDHDVDESWHQALHQGRRIDFHAMRSPLIVTTLGRLLSRPLDQRAISVLHRAFSARPIDGATHWHQVIGQLDADAFREATTWFHFNRIHAVMEDLEGNVREHDVDSAVANATGLMSTAMDALLASRGLTNPRPKWRIKQMRRLGPSGRPAMEAFLDLTHGKLLPRAGADFAHYLANVTQFVRWLQLAVVIARFSDRPPEVDLLSVSRNVLSSNAAMFRAVSVLNADERTFALFGASRPLRLSLGDTVACLAGSIGIDAALAIQLTAHAMSLTADQEAVSSVVDRWRSGMGVVANPASA